MPRPVPLPVRKVPLNPVLEVKDTASQSNVVLVGVSHGAPASASLVRDTIARVKPDVIVLELCNDRYLSISLDAKLRPDSTEGYNSTVLELFDKKMPLIEEYEKSRSAPSYLMANINFMRSQGLLVGTFIGMGLLVTGLQKLFRRSNNYSGSTDYSIGSTAGSTSKSSTLSDLSDSKEENEDEFVTAMRIAAAESIPLRMGDAYQEETLKSVTQVLSSETFTPDSVIQGAKSLAFSSFGWTQGEYLLSDLQQLPPAVRKVPSSPGMFSFFGGRSTDVFEIDTVDTISTEDALKNSQWINIPRTYLDNKKMLLSLVPLLAIALIVPILTDLVPAIDGSDAAAAVDVATSIPPSFLQSIFTEGSTQLKAEDTLNNGAHTGGVIDVFQQTWLFLSKELPPDVQFIVDTFIDLVSVLVLIRLAKIIGSDRDRIIASKIQDVCDEFPGSEIVAVVGMLHCNGVARYLLSGKNPLQVTTIEQQDGEPL